MQSSSMMRAASMGSCSSGRAGASLPSSAPAHKEERRSIEAPAGREQGRCQAMQTDWHVAGRHLKQPALIHATSASALSSLTRRAGGVGVGIARGLGLAQVLGGNVHERAGAAAEDVGRRGGDKGNGGQGGGGGGGGAACSSSTGRWMRAAGAAPWLLRPSRAAPAASCAAHRRMLEKGRRPSPSTFTNDTSSAAIFSVGASSRTARSHARVGWAGRGGKVRGGRGKRDATASTQRQGTQQQAGRPRQPRRQQWAGQLKPAPRQPAARVAWCGCRAGRAVAAASKRHAPDSGAKDRRLRLA